MADLTNVDLWKAMLIIVGAVVGIAVVVYAAFKGMRERKRRQELVAELVDIVSREEIQLLRHRDLDAFARRVNEIRANKGQEPVPKEFLAKIQYNLMYALDESDF